MSTPKLPSSTTDGLERPGVADRRHVDARVAVAATVEAQLEVVDDVGVEHRELAPDRVRGDALPGELGVVVVAIDLDLAVDRVVVGAAGSS